MRICIRRRPQETGGTCVEIEADDKRRVLDVGLPLDADDANDLHCIQSRDLSRSILPYLVFASPPVYPSRNLCLRICRVAEINIDHDRQSYRQPQP